MTAASLKWSSRCRTEAFFPFFSDPDLIFDDIFDGTSHFCLSIVNADASLCDLGLIGRILSAISSIVQWHVSTGRSRRSLDMGTVNSRTSAEPLLNGLEPRKGCNIAAFIASVSPLPAFLHSYSLAPFQLLPFFIPATNEWPLHDVTTLIHNKRNFSSLWNANMIKCRVEASYQSAPS